MSHGTFQLSDTNPNDTTGGGGCVCSEIHDTDCKGPYIVCFGTDMDSSVSPHVVVCRECLKTMNKLAGGPALQVGIPGDEPGFSNPYGADPYSNDVALQRHARSESGRQLSRTEIVLPDIDKVLDDDEPLETTEI